MKEENICVSRKPERKARCDCFWSERNEVLSKFCNERLVGETDLYVFKAITAKIIYRQIVQ